MVMWGGKAVQEGGDICKISPVIAKPADSFTEMEPVTLALLTTELTATNQ